VTAGQVSATAGRVPVDFRMPLRGPSESDKRAPRSPWVPVARLMACRFASLVVAMTHLADDGIGTASEM